MEWIAVAAVVWFSPDRYADKFPSCALAVQQRAMMENLVKIKDNHTIMEEVDRMIDQSRRRYEDSLAKCADDVDGESREERG